PPAPSARTVRPHRPTAPSDRRHRGAPPPMPTLRLLPELEDALRHIQGVRAASVVTGPDAVPTEVHVLADPGKPAKQVVRDVQSLAMARYDIDIDHRIVSVVQMGDDEVRATAPAVATA